VSAFAGWRQWPGVLQWRRRRFNNHFEHNTVDHLFRGVFDSADAALASAPPRRLLGYDNPASSELYLKRLAVDDHDPPAMFWLQQAFDQGATRVADLGGSVGIKYFAFRQWMRYPERLAWRVVDVPAATARGRQFAREQGAGPALEFADDLRAACEMQVLYASGVLQYLPQTLGQLLAAAPTRPDWVIVNTTPIHPSASYFTLNSIGTAYCAYRVQAREAFVREVLGAGYRLRAEWRNVGKLMQLPLHPSHSLDCYSGFCFQAAER
jgi:putative methyltransferase (TIGR04325 family)